MFCDVDKGIFWHLWDYTYKELDDDDDGSLQNKK